MIGFRGSQGDSLLVFRGGILGPGFSNLNGVEVRAMQANLISSTYGKLQVGANQRTMPAARRILMETSQSGRKRRPFCA